VSRLDQEFFIALVFTDCASATSRPNILFIYTDKHNYKYIMNLLETNIEELYDLETDPEELVNLAFHKDYRDTLAQLRREAIAELRRTDCPFVDQLHADLGEQK
jgi:hypothetical protein